MADLRWYQKKAVEAVVKDWDGEHPSTLVVLATGSGKTIVVLSLMLDSALIRADSSFFAGDAPRGLIVAHRQDLIDQPVARIAEFWPEWSEYTGVVMAERNECNRQLTVATVQTLSSERRMQELLAYGPIEYLVIDEAHHGPSSTYMALIERLRQANPNLRVLGVTATPLRADGDGLRKVFSNVAYRAGIKELTEWGYLAPFRAYGIQTPISLQGVKSDDGDFVQTQLANAWEVDNLFDLVVQSHLDRGENRPAMCFTVSVEGAYRLAEKFRAAGIPAEAADGTTKRPDRAATISRFKSGETMVLCNAMLWTEGLDLPKIAAVHMSRPTQSDSAYIQMVGRGLRLHPGKQDCVIFDYAPEDARNIVQAGDLLGKPRKQRKAEEDAEKMQVLIPGLSRTGRSSGLDGDPDEIVLTELNYLAQSQYRWSYDGGVSTLGLGEKKKGDTAWKLALCIVPDGERYRLYKVATAPREKPYITCELESDDFGEVRGVGQEIAERVGAPVLTGKGKSWNALPATEPQLQYLSRLRPDIKRDVLVRMTRGSVAQAITQAICTNALRRAGYTWQERGE